MNGNRPIKRRNAALTKARIIDAAEQAFGRTGYAGASVRDIAVQADIAPSVLIQHFGSKAQLFEIVMRQALDRRTAESGELSDLGSRLVDLILRSEGNNVPSMIALSMSDEEVREIIANALMSNLAQLTAQLEGAGATERALEIQILLGGFVMLARLLRPERIPPGVATWLREAVQARIDL